MGRSVAIADVPDPPLSTEVLIGQRTAQFTLTLLLLHHLKGDLGEFRGAGEDAVGIKLHCFVCHVHSIDARHCHSTELVTVYPLSQGSVPCEHQRYDVTLAGFERVLCRWGFEPTDSACPCERVDLESPDGSRDAGGDAGDVEHG